MENKILKIVEDINSNTLNESFVTYENNGTCEAIKLNGYYIWDDQNCATDFVRQQTLSTLLYDLNRLLEIVSPLLRKEIDNFFDEKEKQMKDKFSHAKMKWDVKTVNIYSVSIFGKYNEDAMDDFMDVLIQDFEFVFESFKLEATW